MVKSFFLFLLIVIFSCDKDEVTPETGAYQNGVFITNEGPFQTGTGTVSFYDRSSGIITQDIYQKENIGQVLGNIVQSMTIIGDKAYIIVNNAQKIEVVEAATFKSIATISGLEQPRYLLQVDDNKAYLSQYGASGTNGEIKIIDLTTNTVTGTISVGIGPERMLKQNNKVYLANGGFCMVDRRVSIINSDTDEVVDHIEIGDNPIGLQIDQNQDLWVITKGNFDCTDFSTTSSTLSKISNYRVESSFELPNGAGNLSINKDKNVLYYTVNGGLYDHPIGATTLSQSVLVQKSFYSVNVDPETDRLFCTDAKDFQAKGDLLIYDSNGTQMDSLGVGIIPGGFWFE